MYFFEVVVVKQSPFFITFPENFKGMALIDFNIGNKRKKWRLPWWRGGSFLTCGHYKHADPIYCAILDKLTHPMKGVQWVRKSGDAETFAALDYLFKTSGDVLVVLLIQEGEVFFRYDGHGVIDIVQGQPQRGDYVLRTADWRCYSKSTREILRPTLDYLNDICNAQQTTVKRLGRLVLLSPQMDEYGNKLTDDELKDEEKKLEQDYGLLSEQSVVKLLNHSYNVHDIDITGKSLTLETKERNVMRIICDKLGVPFELVAAALDGNPNATGIYQESAMRRLFVTVHSWCDLLSSLARQMGVEVEYYTPDAPQDYETAEEELNEKIVSNIKTAEDAGYLTHEEAVALYRQKILKYEK